MGYKIGVLTLHGMGARTIAKSGNTAIEAGDGLDGAEGAAFGSQGHGHP